MVSDRYDLPILGLTYLDRGPQRCDKGVTPAGSRSSGFGAWVENAVHETLAATNVGSKPRPGES